MANGEMGPVARFDDKRLPANQIKQSVGSCGFLLLCQSLWSYLFSTRNIVSSAHGRLVTESRCLTALTFHVNDDDLSDLTTDDSRLTASWLPWREISQSCGRLVSRPAIGRHYAHPLTNHTIAAVPAFGRRVWRLRPRHFLSTSKLAGPWACDGDAGKRPGQFPRLSGDIIIASLTKRPWTGTPAVVQPLSLVFSTVQLLSDQLGRVPVLNLALALALALELASRQSSASSLHPGRIRISRLL